MYPLSAPILSCAEAKAWEEGYFGGDEAREYAAIWRTGTKLGHAVARDYSEVELSPRAPRVLVLVGRGHNGADALVAARVLAELWPRATFTVVFVLGSRALRPQLARVWREIEPTLRGRWEQPPALTGPYHVAIDGLFGFSYRPPLPPEAARWLREVNRTEIKFRAAVDLPSGLGEPDGFFADFTYATGILKTPVLDATVAGQVGRIRFLDIGLFDPIEALAGGGGPRVLLPRLLAPLQRLRPANSDKRTFGHLLVLGGSLHYPGAVLMAVRAALQSGVGLVTAFVPEPLVPAYAAAVPEAMWVGWPTTPDGGLALEGLYLARAHGARGTAWLIGPGLGRDPETEALVVDLVREEERPVVLDADALQPSVLLAARCPLVLTPHAGELARISGGRSPHQVAAEHRAIVVAKGSPTRIFTGEDEFLSCAGGPVLARGGSGDLLAGVVGGRMAQARANHLTTVCEAVHWHGTAADAWARERGATAVRTTELLDFLPRVLREEID